MKLSMRLAAAFAILATSGSSAAPSPAENAIGHWILERSPERCVISRRYGPSEAPVTLGFKAPPLGDAVQIVVVRSGRVRVEQSDATIKIGSEIVRTTALTYPLDQRRRQAAHLINLSGDESAQLRQVGELKVKVVGGMDRPFALGPMAAAWTQLDECLERLRQTWNIGQRKLAAPARAIIPLERLFGPEVYPIRALLDDRSGTTGIILLVDESGAVKDCTLALTSGVALLDSRTCSTILSGAKFVPASDAQGKPAKSAYQRRIRWQVVG